ncbi:Asp23/Gls24 family envelope stress response protein [Anaerococcus sp. mt242]|uniref:Asp23/Gls24 family envelope stress response protein n=1 Tax=unclassified Anaerococcus TaxID=2614126 RepID=UPI001931C2AE|nr:Asp23/Gls24 family envelope stress response protein [Anaerococcus sp. mt242]MBM0046355.1 Asp23/Gls24 family envelope stress response protein [Anaerococcus sp. mt242]
MSIKYVNNLGKVTIDDSVLSNIVAATVMQSYGVVGLASQSAKDDIYQLLKLENMSKGVEIHRRDDGTLTINISIFILYGVRISVVAQNIIDNVKYTVEKSLNVRVSDVNILVQGIGQ